ncbi:MAG: TolC family protein, partial [Planctomycetes bacterium]|nr:TolC family protein [Planctomycetota bacterium]
MHGRPRLVTADVRSPAPSLEGPRGRRRFAGRLRKLPRLLLAALVACSGCVSPWSQLHFFQTTPFPQSEIAYYKEIATQIAEPVGEPEAHSDAVLASEAPHRIRHPSDADIIDLTLADAIHLSLANSEIIRSSGEFLSPGNTLLRNPEAVSSVFDPAIQDSGVLFGRRGVEAALSDFDAQLTSSITWSRSEQVQNNRFLSGGLEPGDTLTEEAAAFTSQLAKPMADGGTFSVEHNWNYTLNNVPSRLFGSAYTGLLRAEYTRPLWAASGTEFTRINGPIGQTITGVTGVSQGVVIARINADITIADFELAVRNLLKDVEDLYWDLALAYRTYDSEVVSRNSALRTWRDLAARFAVGGVSAADEAQARDNYFDIRARAENALADIYSIETRLRRLLGLPVNDGAILRPVTEPATAEFIPDWQISLAEALTRRVELRRQKWTLKSLELQLRAARSLTQPRLDFSSGYQVNAFGDHLLQQGNNDEMGTSQGLNSAYETLTQG